MADFYVIVAPGLEVQALNEIKEVWPYLIGKDGQALATPLPKIEVDRGGLEFSCDEIAALQLNFFLKTATRILWRVKKFKAKDFPKVFQEVSKIQWGPLLQKNLAVALQISAQKSRLNNEKRLASSIGDAFKKLGYQVLDEAPQNLYVRMDNDECTLSLDTTGEMLYRRGWGALKGEAPMRESLAAFVLRETLADVPLSESRQINLVDPFCGSGTLLLEGTSLYAPHWQREFSFFYVPSIPKIFKSESWRKNFKLLPMPVFKLCIGNDLDGRTLAAAQGNADELARQLTQIHPNWTSHFHWQQGACGGLKLPSGSEKIWILSNPPYGDRVSLGAQGSLQGQMQKLIDQQSERVVRIGLLLPPEEAKKLVFQGFEITKEIPLSNGGLKTLWTVWCKK